MFLMWFIVFVLEYKCNTIYRIYQIYFNLFFESDGKELTWQCVIRICQESVVPSETGGHKKSPSYDKGLSIMNREFILSSPYFLDDTRNQ